MRNQINLAKKKSKGIRREKKREKENRTWTTKNREGKDAETR